ncbi:PREDICTED: F-box protein At3g26010-like [Camelina sativa]|uniref:F-box protein At3g26010-like n=1 Tax=Camelina sativa TaxID=90675 RepID=A0ABM0V5V5_CAMSA|nr:PREDICTED: F-box protein At3g26010-like [Camelina sativa]
MRGCETWDLPKSVASYFRDIQSGNLYYAASSSGLWLRIPRPPHPSDTIVFGFVTGLDKDGVVLDFKVVKLAALVPKKHTCLCLWVYSSETGTWTRKRLYCPPYITSLCKPMSLNGTLYVSETSLDDDLPVQPGVLIALDFYSESDLCRVIPLPDHNVNHNRDFKRALSASRGFVMYMKTLAEEGDNLLMVWRF